MATIGFDRAQHLGFMVYIELGILFMAYVANARVRLYQAGLRRRGSLTFITRICTSSTGGIRHGNISLLELGLRLVHIGVVPESECDYFPEGAHSAG